VSSRVITPLFMDLQSINTTTSARFLSIPMSMACIWIIEFSVNYLCAYRGFMVFYLCLAYIYYDLIALR